MVDYKPCATPFQSDVNLTQECPSLKVHVILHCQLVGSLIYSTQSCPYIYFLLVWFLDLSKIHDKVIGKLQR